MEVPLLIASKSKAESNFTYSATSAIATKREKPEPFGFAKRASSKSFADFPSMVTKGRFRKSFRMSLFKSLKELSILLVSEITGFGQFS